MAPGGLNFSSKHWFSCFVNHWDVPWWFKFFIKSLVFMLWKPQGRPWWPSRSRFTPCGVIYFFKALVFMFFKPLGWPLVVWFIYSKHSCSCSVSHWDGPWWSKFFIRALLFMLWKPLRWSSWSNYFFRTRLFLLWKPQWNPWRSNGFFKTRVFILR